MSFRRGFTGIEVLIVVAVLAIGGTQLVPNWRLSHLFAKKPPTAELTAAQIALREAQTKLAALEAERAEAARKASEQQMVQFRYSQQSFVGAENALARVPVAQQGPEVRLGVSMVRRGNLGLVAALGALPQAQADEIAKIMDNALSEVEAERDAAQRALADKDAELGIATQQRVKAEMERDAVAAKIPPLEAKTEKLAATVESKTAEVVKWSAEKVAEEKKSGSLAAFVEKLMWVSGIFVALSLVLGAAVAWYKVKHSGLLAAVSTTIKDAETQGAEVAGKLRQLFDPNLNRSEQQAIAAKVAASK
jgi:prepilin-type N-terminal cleavage/methylation domain-containing protein